MDRKKERKFLACTAPQQKKGSKSLICLTTRNQGATCYNGPTHITVPPPPDLTVDSRLLWTSKAGNGNKAALCSSTNPTLRTTKKKKKKTLKHAGYYFVCSSHPANIRTTVPPPLCVSTPSFCNFSAASVLTRFHLWVL
ncbi:hypothetical protein FQA47_014923 [Oryzias melastigma]|uniref:Uncharacterized protein n=1 Tax=Oryzias melastigma TaxID=30732 RepID=A0A834L179_ORYME|nr:hypothetical protein FQA47_014923 [Oryzias melastigma]